MEKAKFNFDELIVRRGTNAAKWDEDAQDDVIPMWVADMDFQTAPAIRQAIVERAKHGVYGYTLVGESYYKAIIDWFHRRHNWKIEKSEIIYTTGVVPAISATLKALTLPGEKVLVQSPIYNCFFSCIKNQGCEVLETPLRRTGNTYEMDWEDFEKKCSDEKTTVFLLCNPHNPCGRVWRNEELEKIHEITKRHDVTVVSDEIHCELIMPGYHFTPYATICDRLGGDSVIINSPTKNFNIAGLQIANIFCKNTKLYRSINRAINIFEICDVNPFGPIALEAAYNESEAWIEELNLYIYENYQYLNDIIKTHLPNLSLITLEGTYLAWLDISSLGKSSDEITNYLHQEHKVRLNSGTVYSEQNGEGFIRINLACPRTRLKEGVERIVKGLAAYQI